MTPEERFQRDPKFNKIVMGMVSMVRDGFIDTNGLRDAASLACRMCEMGQLSQSVKIGNSYYMSIDGMRVANNYPLSRN